MCERLKIEQLKEKFPNCRFERCAKTKVTKVFNDKWELLKTVNDKKLMKKGKIK